MVEFDLLYEDTSLAVYEYYPEGRRNRIPGVIQVNKGDLMIRVVQCAEDDFYYEISSVRIKEMKRKMNQKRAEQGLPSMTSTEWCNWRAALREYHYGKHVIHMICDHHSRNHEFIKRGRISWY